MAGSTVACRWKISCSTLRTGCSDLTSTIEPPTSSGSSSPTVSM